MTTVHASSGTDALIGVSRRQSPARRRLRVLLGTGTTWLALAVVGFGILMALVPTELLPADPTKISPGERFVPPIWSGGSSSHVLGTDNLGRDVLSRLIYAARFTMLVVVVSTVLSTLLGVVLGLVAGYRGGWADAITTRLIDMQLAFPVIVLGIVVLAMTGSGLVNLILVLVLVDWAPLARVVRASVLATREFDYVEAARAVGVPELRIVSRHVLPNVAAAIVIIATHSAARILLTESSLSFLGLGVLPPAASWGTMVGDGRNYIYNAWWVSTMPGVVIAMMVLAISFLGDALRDALDPRMSS